MLTKFIKYKIDNIPSEIFFRKVLFDKDIDYTIFNNFLTLNSPDDFISGIPLSEYLDLVENRHSKLAQYLTILLNYLEGKSVFYLDIKSDNIIVDINDEAKWKPIDFECCYIKGKKCKLIMTSFNFDFKNKSKFIKNENEASLLMIKALFDFLYNDRVISYEYLTPLWNILIKNKCNKEECKATISMLIESLKV